MCYIRNKVIFKYTIMNSTTYSILVPISFSNQSMIALEQAERLATLTNGEITLLCVIESKGRSLSQSIIDYSNQNEGDLIMIMTQQEADFTTNFMGSSAHSIIYNSNTPVMSIRPEVTIGEVYDLP